MKEGRGLADALVRPLHDNAELELAARAALGEHAPADSSPHAAAWLAAHYERLDASPFRRLRRAFRHALLAAAAAVPLWLPWLAWQRGADVAAPVTPLPPLGLKLPPFPFGSPWERAQGRLTKGLDAKECRLVLPWRAGAGIEQGYRAAWLDRPDDPALCYEHALAFWYPADRLPPGFAATSRRLVPPNGWPLWMQALERCKSRDPLRPAQAWPGPVTERPAREWEIRDPEAAARAVELLREAAAMPRLDRGRLDLLERRLALLPPERDLLARADRGEWLAHQLSGDLPGWTEIGHLVAAEARRLALAGDAGGLGDWAGVWLRLAALAAEGIHSQSGQQQWFEWCGETGQQFAAAMRHAGLDREAERFRALGLTASRELELGRRNAALLDAGEARLFGSLRAVQLPTAVLPFDGEEIPREAWQAGCRADHALLEQGVLALLASLGGLLVAAWWAFPFARGALARRLGGRVAASLRARDHAAICLFGLVLPCGWYLLVSHLADTGGRDFSLANRVPCWILQSLAAAAAAIALCLASASRQLRRRTAPLGVAERMPRRPWLLPALALAALPLPQLTLALAPADGPWEPGTPPVPPWALAAMPLAALALSGGLAWRGARALFGSGDALRRVAVAQAAAPCLAAGVLTLVCLGLPVLQALERHWVARDVIGRVTAGGSLLQERAVERTRAKMLELLAKP